MQKIRISEKMYLLDIVRSQKDKTIKYVFLSDGQIIEFSYINKDDGKDIICIPSQTGCNLGCRFCFLSDINLSARNLKQQEMSVPIKYMIRDLQLMSKPNRNDVLLISIMGCGEPLLNIQNIMEMCEHIRFVYQNHYRVVRFALASLIPSYSLMTKLTDEVKKRSLAMKFHFSLHSPNPETRKYLMPSACMINESVRLVSSFMALTGNTAEIHYSMMRDINDTNRDLKDLISLLRKRNIPIKFLAFNEKPDAPLTKSDRVEYFRKALENEGISTEYYVPPGSDIGSSCGQFLTDYYKKYNRKS